MSVYLFELELLSPAIVSARRVRMNYTGGSSWIPGLTVRGAFLTSLIEEGRIDVVEEEEKRPSLRFSPAYPISIDDRGERKSFPAHFYILFHKRKKRLLEPADWPRALDKGLNSPRDLLSPIEKYLSDGYKPAFGRGLVAFEESTGGVSFYRKVDVSFGANTSVGINKSLRKSEYQMLFNYVAVAEGTRFWGLAIDPEDRVLRGITEREVWVGRATTRGFGHARIRFSKVMGLEDFAAKLSNVETKVLYALSPVAFVHHPVVKGDRISVSLVPPADKLLVKHVGGKALVLGGKSVFTSWFRRLSGERGLRPMFETLSQGSLVFTENKPTAEFYLWLYGEDPGGTLGLNYLLPYSPMLLRGGRLW